MEGEPVPKLREKGRRAQGTPVRRSLP